MIYRVCMGIYDDENHLKSSTIDFIGFDGNKDVQTFIELDRLALISKIMGSGSRLKSLKLVPHFIVQRGRIPLCEIACFPDMFVINWRSDRRCIDIVPPPTFEGVVDLPKDFNRFDVGNAENLAFYSDFSQCFLKYLTAKESASVLVNIDSIDRCLVDIFKSYKWTADPNKTDVFFIYEKDIDSANHIIANIMMVAERNLEIINKWYRRQKFPLFITVIDQKGEGIVSISFQSVI